MESQEREHHKIQIYKYRQLLFLLDTAKARVLRLGFNMYVDMFSITLISRKVLFLCAVYVQLSLPPLEDIRFGWAFLRKLAKSLSLGYIIL